MAPSSLVRRALRTDQLSAPAAPVVQSRTPDHGDASAERDSNRFALSSIKIKDDTLRQSFTGPFESLANGTSSSLYLESHGCAGFIPDGLPETSYSCPGRSRTPDIMRWPLALAVLRNYRCAVGVASDSRGSQRYRRDGDRSRMSVGKRPVVLVVEDEPILRIDAADLIEEAGFEALEAADADEAIALLQSRDDIRIVFTDIDMPGSMDGLKLCRAIRDRWPPIELVVTSGHSRLTDDDLPERGRFLPKPYLPAHLHDVLRQFLA